MGGMGLSADTSCDLHVASTEPCLGCCRDAWGITAGRALTEVLDRCAKFLLTFFYIMLAMQSKTIDSVKDRRACAWGVVGCCSILPRQLSRPLTVVTTIVPDRSPNPTYTGTQRERGNSRVHLLGGTELFRKENPVAQIKARTEPSTRQFL